MLILEAGDVTSPAFHSSSEIRLSKNCCLWAAPHGIWPCQHCRYLSQSGSMRGQALGVLLLFVVDCFTSHPGWRWARMPRLGVVFLPNQIVSSQQQIKMRWKPKDIFDIVQLRNSSGGIKFVNARVNGSIHDGNLLAGVLPELGFLF